ncbi:MAG: type II secretion system GspH family protein [Verrucomicrobia bacterium]|nr:type II secretion system GspH family protein [Verrucomicrobiota bacterium]MCF7709015.1 type II secretion system GspH family protein [Verrucomicrobiota bacterium]
MKLRTTFSTKATRAQRTVIKPRLRGETAFTMIEIAIALAVMAFALVAIIGILPAGFQVQQQNREETIVNADARYFMEVISSGDNELSKLTMHVDEIIVLGSNRVTTVTNDQLSPYSIVGLLSTPYTTNYAKVRAINAPASDMIAATADSGPAREMRDLVFSYVLRTEVTPYIPYIPGTNAAGTNLIPEKVISNTLYEVRLTVNWPYRTRNESNNIPQLVAGKDQRTLRRLVAGTLTAETNNNAVYYFFNPATFSKP